MMKVRLSCSSKEFQGEPELPRELSRAKSSMGAVCMLCCSGCFWVCGRVYVVSTQQVAVVFPSTQVSASSIQETSLSFIHSFIHSPVFLCLLWQEPCARCCLQGPSWVRCSWVTAPLRDCSREGGLITSPCRPGGGSARLVRRGSCLGSRPGPALSCCWFSFGP